MSGHSKWASIKHKKGAADAKRGKVFSKLAKLMTVAAKEGGSDLNMNFSLRMLAEKAKKANMPKDNIERAISRGTGEGADGVQMIEAVYEAMGPGGTAIIVETLTDNTNRTLGNLKNTIIKRGGNFGAKVLWMFDKKGVVRVEDASAIADRDIFELALIEARADDIIYDENALSVYCAVPDLQSVTEAVVSGGLEIESAGLEYVAKDEIKLSEEDEEKLFTLMDLIEEDEDVTNVFSNAA
ncbi:YebC/PmpR family DNA-binding transcriptional regulator [Candidatus Uhrbacteria bacterium CG_4_10_14_0_2_um_filter_41_7]|uniref:Probable transcriptional regulatory protein CO173_00500 n=1 Tax=Candidatus Uhrbacteria bacterium CG_4_9_14_3_um_filter_41_35 TaxID=1975034 RepID=A0A2M7XGP1_9BACT|nr:MAG: YebC/PmpR family DNA-binding transcriptional regulator [Candidatus Uhrbacteria bacterium CG11_big_fil_rev_8_21_14_0_20_41_9]PIZ54804.1 MAG: YebC/PmpR family DNA-binding transcriptional regulator [Candidatus Uhrbacteria bacterium CG_4_10_14_0_2_um_filter_41_7]PJA47043.1 MAG: YebC/PmpR family DNA-binding transcriptional regulator [Candidatus Uhrbacteria bacterium CG_4_9_14_3_um_filter_41_35]